jgi:uncharacterized RDD family membrane protein YckC
MALDPEADPVARPAGSAARATAVLIDGVLVFVVLGVAIASIAGRTSRHGGNASFSLHGGPAVLWLVLAFAYWIVCESYWGMTIGKRLFSIRVESCDGGRPGFGQSLVRNLFRAVDGFPYIVPYLIGFIVAMSGDERMRVGDRVARTRVVRRD